MRGFTTLPHGWTLTRDNHPWRTTDAPEMIFLGGLVSASLARGPEINTLQVPVRFEVAAALSPGEHHTLFFYVQDDHERIITAFRIGGRDFETSALVALARLSRRTRSACRYRVTAPMCAASNHAQILIADGMARCRTDMPLPVPAPGDTGLILDADTAARISSELPAQIPERICQ